MRPEARQYGPLPVARLHGGYLFGEAFSESALDITLRHLMKLFAEDKGITNRGRVHRGACANKYRRDLFGVLFQRAITTCCTQKHLTECQPVLGPKPFRIGREVGAKLFIARLGRRHVLGEEFHFLPHTAANDAIIAIQPRRPTFAVENLFPNVILDEAWQFVIRRRALPRAPKSICQGGNARRRNDDLRGCLGVLLIDNAEKTEKNRPGTTKFSNGSFRREDFKACTRSATCKRARSSSSGLHWASSRRNISHHMPSSAESEFRSLEHSRTRATLDRSLDLSRPRSSRLHR